MSMCCCLLKSNSLVLAQIISLNIAIKLFVSVYSNIYRNNCLNCFCKYIIPYTSRISDNQTLFRSKILHVNRKSFKEIRII